MAEMSQEEMLEQQKKNCIFCRIVGGEVESLKVYEDERFLAIMDIRPATRGHLLLLPKEHVPILPLLAQDLQQELFAIAARIAKVQKDALVAEWVTILAASGYVAGQQAPHLLLHLIPREKGDGLEKFDLPERTHSQADTLALAPVLKQATAEVLKHYGKKVEEYADPREALLEMLQSNEELRKLVIAQPSMVEEYVKQSPKLQKLFEGVDIHALSRMLNRQEEEGKPAVAMRAKEMPEEELFAFIDGNEGLRTWFLEQPEELAARLPENPRLQQLFEGIDIVDLAARYRKRKEAGR